MTSPLTAPTSPPPTLPSAWAEGGLAVLNAGGSDPHQLFPEGAGQPDSRQPHPPVNYHAYAACTHGSFHRKLNTLPPGRGPVLLLLRRDLKLALKCLIKLREEGRFVAISLKESGMHQVAALLSDARRLALFREICTAADAALSSTQELVPFYQGAGAKRSLFIPTPYPVDTPAWDFSRPLNERSGLFVGTREFGVVSRQHLAALLAVRPLGVPVTVVNTDGRSGRRRLESLEIPSLRIVEGRLDYPAYLQLMARHRLVFQLDRSGVPGQVAGDSLLCRVPCVGGDGAVERIAFPDLCGFGRETVALQEKARLLLTDDEAYAQSVAALQQRAHAHLSFAVISQALSECASAPAPSANEEA